MARSRLLDWYDRERRDLPWRRQPDAWATWVSEVMLQQTRVATAIPYFERFMERFPTPAALAAAAERELLAHWSGLGYYRRARQLQAAARAIVAAGGEIPRRANELARLPGVGPYTAAAIASIAFREPVAVVDGNVARVMARLLATAADPARAAGRRELAAAAQAWIDPERPGDSNQALMELGATVCLPRGPRCDRCPLATACRALAADRVEQYPLPRRRTPPRRVARTAALVTASGGAVLLVRRGDDEPQLPGLWELPSVDGVETGSAERALTARYGGSWRLGEERCRVRHAITTRAIELVARRAELEGAGIGEGAPAAFVLPAEALADWPLTAATRKLLARLTAER